MKWTGSTRPRLRRWPFNGQTSRVVAALRIIWLVAVLWYEIGVFYWSIVSCRWPDKVLKVGGYSSKPSHVLLIADPQVLDGHSYPSRSWLMSKLTQFVVDLNMRKSWSATRKLNPDVVVFLGDMMDNGRYASGDEEYRTYYERFHSIFTVDPKTPVFYIPGNHDVGLGNSKSFSPHSRSRYKANFGPINYHASVANHTFVLLDAPGLVEEDYRRATSGMNFDDWPAPAGGAIEYVRKFAVEGSEDPIILFTHIPLFRPDTATCGPLREKGSIRRGVGFGYQNTLGRQTTEYILKGLRPVAVFSGDDHDYCEYTHSIPLVEEGPEPRIQRVREVTVKSFSMAMGIQRPGFQLLSLASMPWGLSRTYADAPCLLPNQLAIYTHRYVPLLIISLLALMISNYRKFRNGGLGLGLKRGRPASLSFQSTHLANGRRRESAVWTLSNPFDRQRSRSPSPVSLNGARTPRLPPTPYANGIGNGNGDTTNGYAPPPAYRASPLPSPGLLSASTPAMMHAYDRDSEDEERFDGISPLPQYVHSFPARRIPGDEFGGDTSDDYFLLTSGRHRRRQGRNLNWSWTFVFRGRRRRVTLGVPAALQKVIFRDHARSYGTNTASTPLQRFVSDVWAVAWPSLSLFMLICIVMFW